MDFSLSCPHPADSDEQMEKMEVKQLQSPPLPRFCSNTDLGGWPRSGAGVLRAAGEVQGVVCGPPGGRPCWGRVARGWRPRGPGSCRRGPRLGRRGYSAGHRARGRTHSRAGSGSRPPARLLSGPRCRAERRPLSGAVGREEAGPGFLGAEAQGAVSRLKERGRCWDHHLEFLAVFLSPNPALPHSIHPQTTGRGDRPRPCPPPF